jgi:threonyl-tRNA synthetase
MSEISVTLPDGSIVRCPAGTPADRVVKAPELLAVMVDGRLRDAYAPLEADCAVEPVTPDHPEALHVLRHSAAHLMAQAVARLWKDVEFAIGPTIEDGFYYDFALEHKFTPEDFVKIEAEMRRIVKEDLPIRRKETDRAGARAILEKQGAKYKLEMLEEVGDETLSFYTQGEFTDWCRGPHLPSTGLIRHFKLMKVAGAYWRGDEKRDMLQRIYGTAFLSADALKDHLHFLEEAAKRDHKKVGQHLRLWSFHEEGPGFPFFLPHGMVLYDTVVAHVKQMHDDRGYQQVKAPLILNEELWHRSGHWDHFHDNMYFTQIDERQNAVKPMNCPGHLLMFKEELHSYRELPLRFFELGLVHRHEKSGVLNGLLRVRAFTQDDAHIFCELHQVKDVIKEVNQLVFDMYRDFGFTEFKAAVATRPESFMGSPEMWERAEAALQEALTEQGMAFNIKPGEGAFYGPKIEFNINDSLKREWQCGTVQVDFSMPERFNLEYMAADGQMRRPVMIHRAILGSIERFLAILTESSGGAFPLWLNPRQVAVVPVSEEKFGAYARQVGDALKAAGLRTVVDTRDESLGKKIREATQLKTNYILVVGAKEQKSGTVAVRRRDGADLGAKPVAEVVEGLKRERETRSIHPTME